MPETRKDAPLPPLPWQLHQTDRGDVVILGATGDMVCALFGDLEYSEAVADLLLRAPAVEQAARSILNLAIPCPDCDGTGEDQRSLTDGCRRCGGIGELCEATAEIGSLRAALGEEQ